MFLIFGTEVEKVSFMDHGYCRNVKVHVVEEKMQ